MKKVFTLIFFAILQACSIEPVQYHMNNKFNEQEARKMMKTGTASIVGQAFLRTASGDIKTCAGYQVDLIPATKYANERMEQLYQNTDRGYNIANRFTINFIPDEVSYHQFQKSTICDAQGNFSFKNISEGTYFVVATVIWNAYYANQWGAHTLPQGGHIMQKVRISKGEKEDIILTY